MWWIGYYSRRYWYVIVLVLLLIFAGVIYYMNNGILISSFDKFENKITIKPEEYKEETIDSESYLKDIGVGLPYIGVLSKSYVPSNLKTDGERDEYLREVEKDPNYMYKKKISWAYGEITAAQLAELVELIGYHLNKNNNVATVVKVATPEQLSEYNQKVVYYTDEEGILYLNLYVEEIHESSDTKKSYFYTFKLKYDMDGKVTIR